MDVKSCGNRPAWCSKCRPDVATWVRSYAHTAGQPLGYKLAFQSNFWRRVDKRAKAECWNWKGGLYRAGGHGRVISRRYDRENGTNIRGSAHRAAWVFTHGSINEGLYVLHTCNTSVCCNPEHLYLARRSLSRSAGREVGVWRI